LVCLRNFFTESRSQLIIFIRDKMVETKKSKKIVRTRVPAKKTSRCASNKSKKSKVKKLLKLSKKKK
jgi:hypothetical protein